MNPTGTLLTEPRHQCLIEQFPCLSRLNAKFMAQDKTTSRSRRQIDLMPLGCQAPQEGLRVNVSAGTSNPYEKAAHDLTTLLGMDSFDEAAPLDSFIGSARSATIP